MSKIMNGFVLEMQIAINAPKLEHLGSRKKITYQSNLLFFIYTSLKILALAMLGLCFLPRLNKKAVLCGSLFITYSLSIHYKGAGTFPTTNSWSV